MYVYQNVCQLVEFTKKLSIKTHDWGRGCRQLVFASTVNPTILDLLQIGYKNKYVRKFSISFRGGRVSTYRLEKILFGKKL